MANAADSLLILQNFPPPFLTKPFLQIFKRSFAGPYKVFDFPARLAALPEGRQSPRHLWPKAFASVFLDGAIRIPNMHRLEAEFRRGVLTQRIGKLSEDAIG